MPDETYLISLQLLGPKGVLIRLDFKVDEHELHEYLKNPQKWTDEQARKLIIARLLKI